MPTPTVSDAVLLAAAAMVPASDSEATTDVLYHSNWLPLTPDWLARFPDEQAVTRFVVSESAARTLASRWLRTQDQHWVHWSSSGRGVPAGCPFKVYVSVLPDDLPEAFARSVEVLTEQGTRSFKLSRHPRPLLRPDRLVAYCATRSEVDRLVSGLGEALDGLPAQGVPFTALSENPAVSWARDPPATASAFAPSWRRWVARKLAAYLHASDSPSASDRAAFARARLGEDGVDTDTWARRNDSWGQR